MILTNDDYRKIAAMIEEGGSSLEYTKDEDTLFIDYVFETDGYIEDDYQNGTGAFVETSRTFYVTAAEAYRDGEETSLDFDEKVLKDFIA